ncbi:DUF4367 domain-containing protein [Calderihabitans maritimus]|nr:DUF4367 domain-containing protein [Calderihabitans maritimus]
MPFHKNKDRPQCSLETRQLIYEIYFERIYKIALAVTRDPAVAEEVAQETFKTAFEKYHTLKEPAKIRAWLTAIALNTARTFYHEQKKLIPIDPEQLSKIRDRNSGPMEEMVEPEGSKLVAVKISGEKPLMTVTLRYSTKLGPLIIKESGILQNAGIGMGYDKDDTVVERPDINGVSATLFYNKSGRTSLVWYDQGVRYRIEGFNLAEEIIKIAKNLSP